MTEFQPGQVAVATVRGVPNVRVFRYSEASWVSSEPVKHTRVHHVEHVTDVHPLVVLDFDAAELSPTVAVREIREVLARDSLGWPKIADQIEQQTRPPKPPEPTGLGAVVEDARGERWIRCTSRLDYAWQIAGAVGSPWVRYDDINAVRVLSDGWEPRDD